MVVSEDVRTCGMTAEIAARVAERGSISSRPIRRVCVPDTPIPFAGHGSRRDSQVNGIVERHPVNVESMKFAYIFDFDGVLVRTMEAHFRCYQRALEEVGVPIDRGQFYRQAGMTGQERIRYFAQRAQVSVDVEAVYRRKRAIWEAGTRCHGHRLQRRLAAGSRRRHRSPSPAAAPAGACCRSCSSTDWKSMRW